jgi:hypothetical protein
LHFCKFLQSPWGIHLAPIINCTSFPSLNYLIGHYQYDGSGGGESVDEPFLPILAIVEALLIPEHGDIFSIQLLWRQVVVDKFHKPAISFLYYFQRYLKHKTQEEKIQQWNDLIFFPQLQPDSWGKSGADHIGGICTCEQEKKDHEEFSVLSSQVFRVKNEGGTAANIKIKILKKEEEAKI